VLLTGFLNALTSVNAPLLQRHLSWSFVSVVSLRSLMDEPRVAASRHPLAGVGAHRPGIVVVVVVLVDVEVVVKRVMVVVGLGVQAVAPGGDEVPGGHGRQAGEAITGAKVFAGQSVHAAAPAPEKLPAGQASQRSAPEALENVPGRHGRQGWRPVRLKVPGVHASGGVVVVVVVEPMVVVVVTIGMQAVAPGGAVVPRGHGRQAMLAGSGANVSAAHRLHDDDPAEPAKLPAGQASQRSAPEALENVPGRHGRQGSVPVRLNDPGAQASGRVVVVVTTVVVVVVTRVQADEPGGAVVPGGHGRQMVDPSAGWNVSAAHGVQLVEPSVSAKVPAGHSEHTIVPGVLEKVPTRQGAHSGSEPVGLNSPGGQSCARAEEEEMRSMRSTAQTRVMNDPLWAGRLQRARSESQEKK
jgi:hypothetical protein